MTDESMAPVYAYQVPGTVVRQPPRRLAGSIIAATVVALAVAALGGGIGWLWAEVAPRVNVIKAEQGFFYADAEPEQAVAADGWFVIIAVIAGVLLAVLAWLLLRRYRGSAVLIGLTLGSLAGAMLAWWVGTKIGMAQFDQVRDTAALGARVHAPLGLRITELDKDHPWTSIPSGVAAVQALAAAAVYTLFSGFSGYSDLRGDPVPEQPMYLPLSFDHQALSFDHQPPSLEQPPPSAGQPPPSAGHWADPLAGPPRPDQFGPGLTGSSDSATGTART